MTLGQLKQILSMVENLDNETQIHLDILVDGRQCVYCDVTTEITLDAKNKTLSFHAEF